jgi:hypothetical protein
VKVPSAGATVHVPRRGQQPVALTHLVDRQRATRPYGWLRERLITFGRRGRARVDDSVEVRREVSDDVFDRPALAAAWQPPRLRVEVREHLLHVLDLGS